MRRSVLYAALLAGTSAIPVSAQSLNVTQGMRANVYGVLQLGPQVRPTSVVQTGGANVVGVMQVGANPSVTVRQSGQLNGAYIGQYGNPLAGMRLPMP